MRPRALAALAAAFALTSPPVHADPALPAGWVAGGPAAPLVAPPSPGRLTRTALQLFLSPTRPALTVAPIALADLDTADVGPAPTYQQVWASNADPSGEAPPDLFVAPRCARVSATGHAVGELTLGNSGPITAQSGGGVMLSFWGLADGQHLYQRLEYETLDRLPDGTVRFTETVARFHVGTCKAKTARRFSAIARPILDGRAYAFRTRCAACAPGERDVIHVVTGGGWGTEVYTRHKVSLAAGSGGGFRTRVELVKLRKFGEAMGRPLPDLPDGKEAVIGVEATQTLGEAAPTLIAYTFDEAPRQWGF